MHQTRAKGGIAIVTGPATGEVLAMANVTATPDRSSAVPSRTNEALTTSFEPGSVNKVITLSAALEEGIARPDTVPACPTGSSCRVTRSPTTTRIPPAVERHRHPRHVVEHRHDRVAQKLVQPGSTGTSGASGSAAAPRSTSRMKDAASCRPREWTGPSIGSIPIGQGVAVTAMQMLAAYNVIANNGVYVAPKLVSAVEGTDGRHASAPSATRRVVSPDTARAMRAMMTEVVKSGRDGKRRCPATRWPARPAPPASLIPALARSATWTPSA